jgi:hypothetical protein
MPGNRIGYRGIPRQRNAAGELQAVLTPETILLAALLGHSSIKALIISFRLLNTPDQFPLLHFPRLDPHPGGYRSYVLNLHVSLLLHDIVRANI